MLKTLRALPLLVLLSTSLPAQPVEATAEISMAQIRSLLDELKIKYEENQEEKYVYFNFELDSYNLTLFRYPDSLLLQAHFNDKLKVAQANNWNQTAQFGRAYLDKEDHPYVEADLRFEGGVTPGALKAFVVRFPEVVDDFVNSLDLSETKVAPALPTRTKPDTSLAKYDLSFGGYTLWYDALKWTPMEPTPDGRREFNNVNGQSYVIVVSEAIPFPLTAFEEIAIENAKKLDPNAKLLSKERRMVNGTEMQVLHFTATRATIPFHFYGYYSASATGSAQVVTYTAESVFDANLAAFDAFLDGLTITAK